MCRIQTYLQDTVYKQLKHKSQMIEVSISELIRRVVEKDLNKTGINEVRTFFDALTPLQSFVTTEPELYVDDIRSYSRIFQAEE